jgi:hypothetical protein
MSAPTVPALVPVRPYTARSLARALCRSGTAIRRPGARAQRAVLPERRNHPRHDDRTDQRPDHQRKDRDRSGYEHYARYVSHDFLGGQVSRHVEE